MQLYQAEQQPPIRVIFLLYKSVHNKNRPKRALIYQELLIGDIAIKNESFFLSKYEKNYAESDFLNPPKIPPINGNNKHVHNKHRRRQYVGTVGTPPPPNSEKLLQKSGVIFQRYILGEWSQKSEKQLVNNVKKSIFHGDSDQKISKFSGDFSRFSSLIVQTRKVLQPRCLYLPPQWKYFLKS